MTSRPSRTLRWLRDTEERTMKGWTPARQPRRGSGAAQHSLRGVGRKATQPAPLPPHPALLPAALLAVLLLAFAPGGCERLRKDAAQPASAPATAQAPAPAAAAGVRPYPALPQVAAVVAEARAILPRVPTDAKPPPLAPADAPTEPAPRLTLVGEGILLRPSAFPDLPQRLRVELYLDERDPPGGYMSVMDARGTARWPILDAYTRGTREGAFADTFRVLEPPGRLRYLALLGVPYESGGQRFRSFEGYLVHPAPGGEVSAQGAIYPIDFGYRLPDPPEPVRLAKALAERIADLRTRFGDWPGLVQRVTDLQDATRRLRETPVPAGQAPRQRQDLEDFGRRTAVAEAERNKAAAALRERLLEAYQARGAVSAAWLSFVDSNDFRWDAAGARSAAYQPLADLRAGYSLLEQVYGALHGDEDAALKAARAAMERALLREQELAPLAPK
jgi:hypothetical protein